MLLADLRYFYAQVYSAGPMLVAMLVAMSLQAWASLLSVVLPHVAAGSGAAATGATGAGGTRVRVATIGVLAAAGMFTLGCWRACKGGVARMGMVRRKFGISNLRPPGRPGSGAKCDCIEGAGAT